MHITLFGGHGKIALLLAPMLVDAGHQVTSIIRNPDHAADVEATGATAVVSSVEDADADTLVDLLTGQDAVVWSAGAGGGSPERTYAVDRDAAIRSMDAASAAGARRYVMVSFSGSTPDALVPEDNPFRHYQDAKIAADEHLRGTDLDWTILGAGHPDARARHRLGQPGCPLQRRRRHLARARRPGGARRAGGPAGLAADAGLRRRRRRDRRLARLALRDRVLLDASARRLVRPGGRTAGPGRCGRSRCPRRCRWAPGAR